MHVPILGCTGPKPSRRALQVNLIPLNPTRGYGGSASSNAVAFAGELQRRGVRATVRLRRGIDIAAGCGQLAELASDAEAV